MGKSQGHVTITQANSLSAKTDNAEIFYIFNPKSMEKGKIKISRKNLKSCISSHYGIMLLKKKINCSSSKYLLGCGCSGRFNTSCCKLMLFNFLLLSF